MSFRWIPTNPKVLELEDAVADVFAVHDSATRGGDRVVVFRGQFLRSPEMVYDALLPAFRALGYIPILRQEAGRDIVMAYPAPQGGSRSSPLLHLSLFVLTVLSTLWAGTMQTMTVDVAFPALGYFAAHWTSGLPFAIALLSILGVHEFGHYFVARHHKLDVSLPYFIPFPLNPLTGTLGAVIRIQSPFESKKALFDVGIAGPLAGLVLAIPIVAIGLSQAVVQPVSPGPVTVFNEPLLFQWMARLIVGERPPGTDIIMNPLLMAGWLGFLITALNLVPISQLDGGHIAYAILGRKHRYFAWGVFAIAAAVTFAKTQGFILMLGLIFLMGVEHPPALNDLTKVGWARTLLGILTLLLALTLITIEPFTFQ